GVPHGHQGGAQGDRDRGHAAPRHAHPSARGSARRGIHGLRATTPSTNVRRRAPGWVAVPLPRQVSVVRPRRSRWLHGPYVHGEPGTVRGALDLLAIARSLTWSTSRRKRRSSASRGASSLSARASTIRVTVPSAKGEGANRWTRLRGAASP